MNGAAGAALRRDVAGVLGIEPAALTTGFSGTTGLWPAAGSLRDGGRSRSCRDWPAPGRPPRSTGSRLGAPPAEGVRRALDHGAAMHFTQQAVVQVPAVHEAAVGKQARGRRLKEVHAVRVTRA